MLKLSQFQDAEQTQKISYAEQDVYYFLMRCRYAQTGIDG